ncbi:S-adenosyl-L-methionine-dependent methyltransferase [Rhodofomes roseus]|uniref:S-adenosyl-L-methionine-dependent methyltransferase n=1 Tax=Rhodofomes roseus TaxID=34475 RepID=A0ABQ8L064_9APHY|nr:S-adenosyl-L-methionine-dependent methyltransferase [Rhodofomes roseus]KAH9844042.1 S-adenosyl-L-methionine-dependent methyltransferase [Rhodofomes roseus]
MSDITEKILSQSSQVQLRQLIKEDPVDGWDKAWQNEVTPWDAGEAQPPLRSLLASGLLDLPETGKAFVPGCGRGYDALTIASLLGYETLATDISPAAVEAAKKFVASMNNPASSKVRLEVKDFFVEQGPYDLVYDYTFFVALPPSQRGDWGRQMTALVKPGGYLVTLLFPILDQPQDVGPPFRARHEDYVQALGSGWQKVVDEVPKDSLPTHQGIERLLVWKLL